MGSFFVRPPAPPRQADSAHALAPVVGVVWLAAGARPPPRLPAPASAGTIVALSSFLQFWPPDGSRDALVPWVVRAATGWAHQPAPPDAFVGILPDMFPLAPMEAVVGDCELEFVAMLGDNFVGADARRQPARFDDSWRLCVETAAGLDQELALFAVGQATADGWATAARLNAELATAGLPAPGAALADAGTTPALVRVVYGPAGEIAAVSFLHMAGGRPGPFRVDFENWAPARSWLAVTEVAGEQLGASRTVRIPAAALSDLWRGLGPVAASPPAEMRRDSYEIWALVAALERIAGTAFGPPALADRVLGSGRLVAGRAVGGFLALAHKAGLGAGTLWAADESPPAVRGAEVADVLGLLEPAADSYGPAADSYGPAADSRDRFHPGSAGARAGGRRPLGSSSNDYASGTIGFGRGADSHERRFHVGSLPAVLQRLRRLPTVWLARSEAGGGPRAGIALAGPVPAAFEGPRFLAAEVAGGRLVVAAGADAVVVVFVGADGQVQPRPVPPRPAMLRSRLPAALQDFAPAVVRLSAGVVEAGEPGAVEFVARIARDIVAVFATGLRGEFVPAELALVCGLPTAALAAAAPDARGLEKMSLRATFLGAGS